MSSEKIAIVGGGNMGRALVGGLLRRGVRPEHINVGEASQATRTMLVHDFGVAASADNAKAVADATLLVLAVKPQEVAAALAPVASLLQRNRAIVLSVAAGVRIAAIEKWCGGDVSVVRAMPNRPALVGAGVTALFASVRVTDTARVRAESAMRAVGEVVWVRSEDELDVVTALSGSGPAYFFLLAEAMTQASVELGLEPEVARQLTVGTLHGAGMLARESNGDMARLRCEVTSKGGTTEAALHVMEHGGFGKLVALAIEAATQRGRQLAAQFGNDSP